MMCPHLSLCKNWILSPPDTSIATVLKTYFLRTKLKKTKVTCLTLNLSAVFWVFLSSVSLAQIKGDGTVNTLVDYSDQIYSINGGKIVDKNIFHSFSEFSLSAGQEAFFNNSTAVNNIISRVTGASKSNIDGLIRANCCANLFFINPNGIIFGPNASLDIGGSFLGSTASEIIFADGNIFSARDPQSSILSVSIPSGLNFRDNSGSILVNGTGHSVTAPSSRTPPTPYNVPIVSGLQVKTGQTLALVGNTINLNGGSLNAPSGNVELGSINSGVVTLNSNSQSWNLNYDQVTEFKDITLSQKSLIDTSGSGGGYIHIEGANITLTDGSLIHIKHDKPQTGDSISLKAIESINLIGSTSSENGLVPSAVLVETEGDGIGGDINISAQNLLLKQGGTINSSAFESGTGSDINVNVSDSTQLIETLGLEDQTLISSQTTGSGGAGNLFLSTKYLNLLNGGAIGSATFDIGDSGNVHIIASDVELSGGSVILTPFLVTTISSVTLGSGNSGRLTIDTQRLKVLDGAIITTSTFSKGNSGILAINASDSVLLSGISSENTPSLVASSAPFRPDFGFPEPPTGQAGDLFVNTPSLSILGGARINTGHSGSGDAGDLFVTAGSILLDRGSITANTESGLGGNIDLTIEDGILMLQNSSIISANSRGDGDGGNINIQSPFLVSFPNENSDIIANSLSGRGGRVEISATGIFGFVPRSREELQQLLGTTDPTQLNPRLLPSNDITAISQSNPSLNGQVTLTTLDVDPSKNLVELPTTVLDPNMIVAQQPCDRGWNSSFTLNGRGGTPPTPQQDLSPEAVQIGLVEAVPIEQKNATKTSNQIIASQSLKNLQQPTEKTVSPAQGWIYNNKGEVALVAYDPTLTAQQRLQQHAVCSANE